MAVNVTVRDIENYPGGTAKTVTVDIVQIVPAGSDPEGDEQWIASMTTAATASGGGSIQNIYKNQMKRGWIRSSGLITGNIDIPADARMKIAIDENIGSGVDVTLTEGNNRLAADIAQDIEDKLRLASLIGGGGAKAGDLSYLNAQVRFVSGRFEIESGTVGEAFTSTGRSSVKVGAPSTGTDIRATLGFDITLDSETLAARQIIETDVTDDYLGGDLLTVRSTAGLSAGNCFTVTNGTNSQSAVISGAVSASVLQFVTASGVAGLDYLYETGAMVRLLHVVDVSDPVSAITTTDELYRFGIDSLVNQINFAS